MTDGGKRRTRPYRIGHVYQQVSPKHLKRYTGEFDFRYNTRDQSDLERTAKAVAGAWGKRLTYRRTGETGHA